MEFYSKNLLIVGAGFSFNAGLPLASKFTPALLNLDKLDLDGPSSALVAFVREFVDKTFGEGRETEPGKWPDLEDIFTLVDLSANTGHHLGKYSASELRVVRRALIVRMIRMLSQAYVRRHRRPDATWNILEKFFQYFDANSTAVLSMNWDTVFEQGLARTQNVRGIVYGCDASAIEFDSEKNIRPKHLKPGTQALHLTKPHGSVNWLYCDACREVFWVSPSQTEQVARTLFRKRDWDVVRAITGLRSSKPANKPMCPHCKHDALGTRFATFSYRKALDFPMHAASWKTAERHLKDADNWIFFGYSMPGADFDFKYLLKRVQLSEKIRPRIIVITGGSDADQTAARFERFFGSVDGERIYYKEGLCPKVLKNLQDLGVLRSK
jgi:NAD-dependent SIR2 family protein deacetylase